MVRSSRIHLIEGVTVIPNVWRKSERSNPSGNCVEVYWQKSTRSNGSGGNNCVEVRGEGDQVLVRDTKLGEGSPVISMNKQDWLDFTSEIKRGITCPIGGTVQVWMSGPSWEIVDMAHVVDITDSNLRLSFTRAEWDAFIGGVQDGEFDLK
jgi:hypothetical protein